MILAVFPRELLLHGSVTRRGMAGQQLQISKVRIPMMPDGYSNLKPDRYC